MCIKIIKEQKEVTEVEYHLNFKRLDVPGGYFSFECNKDGEVLDKEHINYIKCISGEYKVGKPYVEEYENSWLEPKIGECICGKEIALEDFTNTCEKCGRDYNWNGSLLADRSQWGEETGEHWSDCY